jgi:hypothetical protein
MCPKALESCEQDRTARLIRFIRSSMRWTRSMNEGEFARAMQYTQAKPRPAGLEIS